MAIHTYRMAENSEQTKHGLPRATHILLLLNSSPNREIEGKVRLEKLVFLLQKRLIENMKWGFTLSTYKFRAYNYGPFSEEILDDIASLKMLNLISVGDEDQENPTFRITLNGEKAIERALLSGFLSHDILSVVKQVTSDFGNLPLGRLVERVYREYPDYTVNSLISSQGKGMEYIGKMNEKKNKRGE